MHSQFDTEGNESEVREKKMEGRKERQGKGRRKAGKGKGKGRDK
jgi:hypothetical protein